MIPLASVTYESLDFPGLRPLVVTAELNRDARTIELDDDCRYVRIAPANGALAFRVPFSRVVIAIELTP